MSAAYRVVQRYTQPCADLERSIHPEGSDWRNWRLVTGALPIEIAHIRADCGNGLITNDERLKREAAWGKALLKLRRARRSA